MIFNRLTPLHIIIELPNYPVNESDSKPNKLFPNKKSTIKLNVMIGDVAKSSIDTEIEGKFLIIDF